MRKSRENHFNRNCDKMREISRFAKCHNMLYLTGDTNPHLYFPSCTSINYCHWNSCIVFALLSTIKQNNLSIDECSETIVRKWIDEEAVEIAPATQGKAQIEYIPITAYVFLCQD